MAEIMQATARAAASWSPELRPAAVRARSPGRCLGMGAALGVVAGGLWGTIAPIPVVRSESLAALPAAVPAAQNGRHDLGQGLDRSTLPLSQAHAGTQVRAEDSPSANLGQGDATVGVSREVKVCRETMQLVEGDYCSTLAHRCLEPSTDGSGRCSRYANGARCYPPVIAMRFCIDVYEYPNRLGEKPRVMVSFDEAKSACEADGKRLCTGREWTLACEGPDRLPYPNGNTRDRTACNIDQPHRFPDVDALSDSVAASKELERLDQRVPSGSMPACVSQFGVYDMAGNVDEWVVPDGPEEAAGLGARTALKGGYFGPVRARCRPSTPTHGPTFKFYQVGFRCCSNASIEVRPD